MFPLFHSQGAKVGFKHPKQLVSQLIQRPSILNSLLTLSLVWVVVNLSYVYLVRHGAKAYRVETSFFIFGFFVLLKLVSGKAYEHGADALIFRDEEKAILVTVALFCWLLIYLPFLKFPFLSDDYVFLMRLKDGHHIVLAEGFFRPIFNLVFFVLLRIFGYTALPFHVLGFSLHLGCSVLVYFLLERMFKSFAMAFLGALVFLFSPVQAEAVLWISGLQELLWVFWLLLAAFFYTRTEEIGKTEIILASLFTAVALLSKETAVCFILFFPALDIFAYRFKRGRHLKWAYIAFVIILAFFGLVRAVVLTIPSDFLGLPNRLFIKNFLIQPFKVFVAPWNQSYFGGLAALKYVLLTAGALILCAASLKSKIGRPFLLGIGLIYAGVLPLYRMFYVALDLQGSRYLYFSVFGWSVVLASVFQGLIKRKAAYVILSASLLLGLGLALSGNLLVWKKAGGIIQTLPENMVREAAPDNFYGAYILRNGYDEFKILKLEIKDFKKK